MQGLKLLIALQALSVSLALEYRKEEIKKVKNETSIGSLINQLEVPQHIFATSVMIEISKNKEFDEFKEYIDHVKKRGAEVIRNTSKEITQDLKPTKNITQDVGSAIDIYEKKIESYVNENYINMLKSQSFIDEVYMFLDILNTAFRYLLREQRKCFHDLSPRANTGKANNSTNNSALNLFNIIFRQTTKFKKDELLYICNHHQICKPYSAFSHNFYNFLSEIMTLDRFEFKKLVELLNRIIIYDEDFTQLTNANENIIKNITSAFSNVGNVLESLEVLRALLIHRYKIIHIPNLMRKRKVQAVRVILDTLDKVLSFDHDQQIDMNIDVAIAAVKNYSKNCIYSEDEEAGENISDFVNSIFKALSRSGDYFIPYLIDTILTGKIVELEEYKYLFHDGSKNVFAAEETF